MGAQAKDSEDETEDAGTGSLSSRRIDRRTPIREIRTKYHVDSVVHAPSGGPTVSTSNVVGSTGKHLSTPEQFMKAYNASKKSSDIRTDSGTAPDTKCDAMSVDNDTLN
jgi:topoisomerase (DNA) II binding protein 1